ncbi:MAG: GNAT family N-acetyltransferase [Treponema sp.]|nr:GNAT family N-acetyltransferase [Treponema sp.]
MEYVIGKKMDLENILKLYRQFNQDIDIFAEFKMEDANIVWDEIEKYNIKYFLAKDNGIIIGSCYICIIPNLTYNGKSIGFIENVITDEKYRGKGIGKKLMEMAIEYAKENNCYKIILQSGIKRPEAHKFYEKVGFNGESKKAFELRL